MADSHGNYKDRSGLAALDLADRGWRVIPLHDVAAGSCSCGKAACGSAGKHPRTEHGLKDASTDPAAIRAWWERWPAANIGVGTGPESGVWMLGPDGQAGIDALAELEREHGELPRTPRAKSGSGGRHYYFRWPDGDKIGNRKNHRGLPIDARGQGGYFVAPPSRNKNGAYEWEVHPNDCDLADAPEWLLEWVRGDGKTQGPPPAGQTGNGISIVDRAIAYLAKMPPAVSGQGGHNQTMEAARVVAWGFDLGGEPAFQILATHYNPRCQPPWTEKELRHKCQEAVTVPFDKPRGWLLSEKTARGGKAGERHKNNGHGSAGLPLREAAELRTTCAAGIKPKPLRWLVPEMLPLGKLALLAGDGGLGKSVITIDLAARLSRGESAFGLEYSAAAGDTLIASCEDDPADTVVPRLLAAGADLTRIHFLDGVGDKENGPPWSLAHHAALDKHLTARPNIRLFIIDPASAFAGLAGIDGHKDAELRALLGPLTEVAARHAVTVLLVAHLGKNETVRAVRRVLGSVAWVNAVRAAWIVAEREEDAGKRLLLPVKANLAPRRRGLVYQLIPLSETEQDLALADIDELTTEDLDRLKRQLFRVVWLGETDAEADKVFAAASRRPEPPSDIKRAADWLRARLQAGPVESDKCVRDGNAALSLSKPLKWWRDTILKGELQGKPQKDGFNGGWRWTLRDSSDSSDSSSETSEKRGSPAGAAADGTMQNHRETDEESQESQESQRSAGWTAADADPRDLRTPFDTREPGEEG